MAEYIVQATDVEAQKPHRIITSERARALRYAAYFSASVHYRDTTVETGGKTYHANNLREVLP